MNEDGRSRNIDILDCYLRRNLAVHGGILDEVHFIRHTRISEDLEFLEGIVASEPSYKAYDSPRGCSGGNYGCIWPLLADPHTLYIKLDDDIVCYSCWISSHILLTESRHGSMTMHLDILHRPESTSRKHGVFLLTLSTPL